LPSCGADAERERHERQHEAGDRDRVLVLDLQPGIDIEAIAGFTAGDVAAQFGNRLFGRIPRRRRRKHGLRIEAEAELRELGALIARVGRAVVCWVPWVSCSWTSFFGRSTITRPSRAKYTVVAPGFDVSAKKTSCMCGFPPARGRTGHAPEPVEQHARPDVVLDLRRDFAKRDFADAWFASGVRRSSRTPFRPSRAGRAGRRAEQAVDADAARLHRDELTVGRQPAERNQQAQQDRHRDADRQCLRHQQNDQLRDDPRPDALGEQRVAIPQTGG